MEAIQAVLSFWFGKELKPRKEWFTKNPAFDAEVRSRFLSLHEQAIAGQLDSWRNTPEGSLALILLLDQFSRNLFRGQPQAFASDPQALAVAQHAIAQGFDQQVPLIQRVFFYLPLEHSENLAHQAESVRLFQQFENVPELKDYYDYALRHQVVIAQFGRFPHRNEILNRPSTPEEVEFLQQPGSSF